MRWQEYGNDGLWCPPDKPSGYISSDKQWGLFHNWLFKHQSVAGRHLADREHDEELKRLGICIAIVDAIIKFITSLPIVHLHDTHVSPYIASSDQNWKRDWYGLSEEIEQSFFIHDDALWSLYMSLRGKWDSGVSRVVHAAMARDFWSPFKAKLALDKGINSQECYFARTFANNVLVGVI